MASLVEQLHESCHYIEQQCAPSPEVGIILGTGLGALVDEIKIEAEIPYERIPHFARSTVEFHAGKLILGSLSGKKIIAMQGRFHYYEGYTMQQITFPVRVMKQLGCSTLLVSCASGCVNPQFAPGDIMIISDHINLLGDNPLIGINDEKLGPRFPDMSEPYSRELISLAETIALQEKIALQKGVYAAMTGPSLETAAEYRFLRFIGADVVGMSTVPETIVAVHAGLRVLGLSVITDACFADCLKPANIEEIIQTAKTTEPTLTILMKKVLERL